MQVDGCYLLLLLGWFCGKEVKEELEYILDEGNCDVFWVNFDIEGQLLQYVSTYREEYLRICQFSLEVRYAIFLIRSKPSAVLPLIFSTFLSNRPIRYPFSRYIC